MATADDVRALAQLVGAAAAVVELQGDRGAGGPVAALAVTAVAAGLLPVVGGLTVLGRLGVLRLLAVVGGLAVLVLGAGRLGVAAARWGVGSALGVLGVLRVLGGPVVLAAVSPALRVALVVAAALLRVGGPLLGQGVAALVRAGRPATVVAVTAVALRAAGGLAAGRG